MVLPANDDFRLRVLAISGSLQRASVNTGLLRAAREVAPDGMEISIFDIRDLPFYDGELEAEGDPASVVALKSAIREVDGVLLATPEYNWGTSGVLKNAIDWASRDREEGSTDGQTSDNHRRRWQVGHRQGPVAASADHGGNRLGADGQAGGADRGIQFPGSSTRKAI